MSKSVIQAQFDFLISKLIWPLFKNLGYSKRNNNFSLYDSAGWGKIINFQKSLSSNQDAIRFRINTGLYLLNADHTYIGVASAERFLEPDCLIRKRIGSLNGSSEDLWYDLSEQMPLALVQQQVLQDIAAFVLPYLNKINSIEDIIQQLIRERNPNSELAIRTLYSYGYRDEALLWLDEEIANAIYRIKRQQLVRLRESLATGDSQ